MTKKYVRLGFTPAQKTELWERWRGGEQMKSIGRELGKRSSSIFSHIRSTGGFTPVARKRSRLALSLTEREDISRGLVAGRSVRMIARLLGRAASTVSREFARNGGVSRYRAVAAEKRALKQGLRPKPCKLVLEINLRKAVILSLNAIGHRSRLRAGSSVTILTARTCTYHMKHSIRPYMCRLAGL